MATENAVDADAGTDADADDRSRPRFRGCVFCYTAELAVYAARKARH
ncbi:MAG: hypothetical protein ABEJ73_04720 [Haloplanus sp.]